MAGSETRMPGGPGKAGAGQEAGHDEPDLGPTGPRNPAPVDPETPEPPPADPARTGDNRRGGYGAG